MRIHLVNPSDVAFGVGVITPRWLYVLAAATPSRYGTPVIVDEMRWTPFVGQFSASFYLDGKPWF